MKMISNRSLLIATGAAAVVAIAGVNYCLSPYYDAEAQAKVRLFDRFCSATRAAVREDQAIFARGALADREEALRRFYTSHAVYHGSQSVALCLDDQLPATPSDCFFAENWACLADFAGTIERAIRESPLSGGR